jgi:molecular chaperone GrpE
LNKTRKEKTEKEINKEEIEEIEESTPAAEEKAGGKQDEVSQLRDQLLRRAAEFENYKKRTENEISSYLKYANEELISELLPVLDDFDRVISSWDEKHDVETFKKGVELIYDKFKKVLGKKGLKEMESTGKPFDVNLHDALMQVENDELEPNTVADTVEKGYWLKDKVLRHAKVLVSKNGEGDSGEGNKGGN